MNYRVTCPQCGRKNYQYGHGCHSCGALVGWPDASPTPYQASYFARHGLESSGGSNLRAIAPSPSNVIEGRSFFGIGVDIPGLLTAAFSSGSGVWNMSKPGSPRGNVIYHNSASVGYRLESGGSRVQFGVRFARYDMPGIVHPYPSDVPEPDDIFISGSEM